MADTHRGLTLTFSSFVIWFAYQFTVLHQVILIAGVQLTCAHGTRKALKMVDVVLGATDDLRRRNAQIASGTFGAESSAPTARDINKRHCYTFTRLFHTHNMM